MKRMVSLALVLLMALTLMIGTTACGEPDDGGNNGGTASVNLPQYEITDSKVQWLCWNSKSSLTDEKEYLYEVNELMKSNYNCELEIVRTTYDELPTKAASLVLSDKAPELIFYRAQDYNNFITQNLVMDVSSYIDFSDPLWAGVKDVCDSMAYNGKYYLTVTQLINNSYIYYWKNVFTDAGLETPLQKYRNGTWTLSAMQELMKQVTTDSDRDGLIDMYGLSLHAADAYLSSGSDLAVRDENGKWVMNLRDTKLNTFFNFVHMTGSTNEDSRLMSSNVTTDFLAKKSAMAWYEAWYLGTLGEYIKSGEIEFAPSPRVDGTDKYYVPGRIETSWVGANCDNPGGAMAYLAVCRYLSVDEAQITRLREKEKALYNYTDEMYALKDEMNSDKFEKVVSMQASVGNWASDEGMWNLWSDVNLFDEPWANIVEKFAPILQANVDSANK